MAHGDFLPRITAFDKALRPKAFDITKSPKYDGYQRGLAAIFLFFCFLIILFSQSVVLKVKFCLTSN